jgi:ubiquinone/menaquinone biosynthesis C-methylase UbiE
MGLFGNIKENIDREIEKDGFLHHYKLMLFFLFNRYDNSHGFDEAEGEMYVKMRYYFARNLIKLLNKFVKDGLRDKTCLDVGGATGDFCNYISGHTGARCVNIDTDKNKILRANFQPSALGDGCDLNFEDNSFDIVVTRGVIEHVPVERHTNFINECFRVLKPGGIGYLTSSSWFAPWAGHQLAPFHLFPIRIACFLANFFYRKHYSYNSYAEAGLYYLSFRKFKAMLLDSGFKIQHVEDPVTRLDFLAKIPLLREVLVQHMAFVVKKPKKGDQT